MSGDKKLEYYHILSDIDKTIGFVKTLPYQDVRVKGWLDDLYGYRYEICGFLHDLLMDERDPIIMRELQENDARLQRGELE